MLVAGGGRVVRNVRDVVDEAVGDETRTTVCVTPRQYPQGDDVGDGIEWHPQADVDVGIDAVVGIVLMPWRLRRGPAGLLHQNVLVVEARTSRSHQVGGDPRQRTREGGTSIFRNSAPVDVVVEEATAAAALVVACVYRSHSTSTWSRVVVRPGARRGHVGVDAALEGREDLVGDDPSQDDESVAMVRLDVVFIHQHANNYIFYGYVQIALLALRRKKVSHF